MALKAAVMRHPGTFGRRNPALWLMVVVTAVAAASLQAAPSARSARTLTWPELLQRASHVAVVEVAAPGAKQTAMDSGALHDYVRHQRRMTVQAVLAGPGLAVGQLILVDDVAWRGELAHHRRCQALKNKQPAVPCADLPDKDALASQLSREPRPGQVVLVALRKVDGDWQLAAERAMDSAELRPQVEQWLRQGKGGRR